MECKVIAEKGSFSSFFFNDKYIVRSLRVFGELFHNTEIRGISEEKMLFDELTSEYSQLGNIFGKLTASTVVTLIAAGARTYDELLGTMHDLYNIVCDIGSVIERMQQKDLLNAVLHWRRPHRFVHNYFENAPSSSAGLMESIRLFRDKRIMSGDRFTLMLFEWLTLQHLNIPNVWITVKDELLLVAKPVHYHQVLSSPHTDRYRMVSISEVIAYLLIRNGETLHTSGNSTAAEKYFRRAYALAPYNAVPAYTLAVFYNERAEKTGEAPCWEDARTYTAIALDLVSSKQKKAALLGTYGDYCMYHNNWGPAVGNYKQAARVAGHERYKYLLKLSKALSQAGRHDEAMTAIQDAAGSDHPAEEKIDPMVNFHAGMALEKNGRVQEAIRYYEQAIEQDPDLLPVYDKLAALYYNDQGSAMDLDRVIYFFEGLARLRPNDRQTHARLSQLYIKKLKNEYGKNEDEDKKTQIKANEHALLARGTTPQFRTGTSD